MSHRLIAHRALSCQLHLSQLDQSSSTLIYYQAQLHPHLRPLQMLIQNFGRTKYHQVRLAQALLDDHQNKNRFLPQFHRPLFNLELSLVLNDYLILFKLLLYRFELHFIRPHSNHLQESFFPLFCTLSPFQQQVLPVDGDIHRKP